MQGGKSVKARMYRVLFSAATILAALEVVGAGRKFR
jgi:hypothetical protein